MASFVSAGMDIDDAGAVLRAHGFEAGTKYHPTDDEDYYWLDIPMANRTPFTVIILRALGMHIQFYYYGCLEAGLDEKVRKIM